MISETQATKGIRRVWNLACSYEGIDASHPEHLPRLFALDRELNIPNGFYYSLNCMATVAAGYCASHIGTDSGGSGCGGGGGCSSSSGDSGSSSDGSGCGGGCGGGD